MMIDTFKQIYRFLSPKFQNLFLDYPVKLAPRYGHGKPVHQGLNDIIQKNTPIFISYIEKALHLKMNIQAIQPFGVEQDSKSPTWNNGFLPGLDIISIYTMIVTHRPITYLEVGSGNSTKVAYKAIKDHGLDTKIVSIDPHPRAEIDILADKIIRQPFENIDYSEILNLQENDILFIDNSHRIFPNSDAMVFFMEILPKLQKGVIVHIHDIYLPHDYPQFMCERGYNEQYALACYLMANPTKYQVIMPNYYLSQDKSLATKIESIWDHPNLANVERHGGSFWIKIDG
jgi:Methyltransferase domain